MKAEYKRVLLKISGEALAGDNKFGIDSEVLGGICDSIKTIHELGVEIGIVIGGGNFWRGRSGKGMDRTTADHMGMLATVINSLGLQDALESRDIPTRVMTAIEMRQIAEPYIRRKAVSHLKKNIVVIFACGTGNPFFSTDTAAALRAAEIDAEIILFAKNIDGVYDSDPNKNPKAKRYNCITYMDVLNQRLAAIDSTATSLCMDNNITAKIFAINKPDNMVEVITGKDIGTVVANSCNLKE